MAAVSVQASPGITLWRVTHVALWTIALSLPQGLLALPIAVAKVGLGPGLVILLLVGALNTATIAWTARTTAAYFAAHGTVPSLTVLAGAHLGPGGTLLVTLGGAGHYVLVLLASLVGLARSLGELTQAPSWLWGLGAGLALLLLTSGRAALSTRLVAGFGLLNLGLLVTLLLLLLPRAQVAAPALSGAGSPLLMVGVSLTLFFSPLLLAPVAREVLPGGADPRALVRGCAAGVVLSAGLLALWAVAVCGSASGASLAVAGGTALPVVLAALPAGRVPVNLFGLLLLGLTALRCAIVLKALAEEQLPRRLRRRRGLLVQLPAAAGLLLAVALLAAGASSFTQLIAVAGACTTTIVSLLIPTLLQWRASADTA